MPVSAPAITCGECSCPISNQAGIIMNTYTYMTSSRIDAINAFAKLFHPDCFKCKICKTPVGRNYTVIAEGQVHPECVKEVEVVCSQCVTL